LKKNYISQGSVATQLRCGGIFSNHFITNFPQNVPVKNLKIGRYLAKIWTKNLRIILGAMQYRVYVSISDNPPLSR